MKTLNVKPISLAFTFCFTACILASCANKHDLKKTTNSYVAPSSSIIAQMEPSNSIEPILPTNMDNQVYENPIKEQETIIEPTVAEESKPKLINDIPSLCSYLDSCDIPDSYSSILYEPELFSDDITMVAAYNNLKNYGYTINDVINELDNILLYSQVPMGIDIETWDRIIGKLDETIPMKCNPFNVYFSLAKKVHELTCKNEHFLNEFCIYTCLDLQERYEAVRPRTLEEFLDENITQDTAYQKIKKDMLITGKDFYDYCFELETLLLAQENPTDYHDKEDWLLLFGNLDGTLEENENLYDTYINLSIHIHNLIYPDDTYELLNGQVQKSRILAKN